MKKEAPARLDLNGCDIDAIIAQVNKKYGENTLIRASDAEGMEIQFISTGCHYLDFAMSGGFPRNRITELRGSYSALKSTLMICGARNFLATEPEGLALICDAEHSFDPSYSRKLQVDNKRLQILNPDSGEQAVDVMCDYLTINDRPIYIGLDSIAALVPTAEIESQMDQQLMGTQARLVNRFMRVATSRLKRSMYDSSSPNATLVCLNQLREKIGVMFGNPETTPGGKGKDYFFSTIVRVSSSPSDAIKEDVEVNKIKRTIRVGQNVKFTIQKNKCGSSQFEQGEFEYYVRKHRGHSPFSFNNAEALFRLGAFHEVIQVSSEGRYEYGKISCKRESDFVKALMERPKTSGRLYSEILQAISDAEEVEVDLENVIKASK